MTSPGRAKNFGEPTSPRPTPAPLPTTTERLDVERLARALNATVGRVGWLRSSQARGVDVWRANAEAIAAEYMRDLERKRGE